MNLYESKPELELIQPKLEIEEEEVKNEPGTSNSSWNCVESEEKPEIFREGESETDSSHFNYGHESGFSEYYQEGNEEKPGARKRVRELQKESGIKNDVAEEIPILEDDEQFHWQNKKRKRFSILPFLARKTTDNPPPNKNPHPVITKCFSNNKHPSVQLMVEISEMCQMTFRQVFEQFENLRNVSRTFCPMNDTCSRTGIRFRFEADLNDAPPPNSGCQIGLICLEYFKKLNWREPIEEKDIHLILESKPDAWHISPIVIRTEWARYQKQFNDILTNSKHRFPGDQLHFTRNHHPTVEQMRVLSLETRIPYEKIFERFCEFRLIFRVKCDLNDTCWRIRLLSARSTAKPVISVEGKKMMDNEFEEAWNADNRNPDSLPLHYIHSIMGKLKLTALDVQNQFWLWSQGRRRRKYAPVKETPCNQQNHKRARFAVDRFLTNAPPNPPSNIRTACLNVFRQVDLTAEIDDTNVDLILMYNPNKRHLTPSSIRNEWNLYRVEIYKILEMSEHKFPNDQAFFARNAHPSVQEMIDLSEETGKPYGMVYERFEELRYAKRVTCAQDDTCQIIRNCPEPEDVKISEENKRILIEKVERIISTTGLLTRSTPLHFVHLMAERFRLPCVYILELFNQLKRRNLREDVVPIDHEDPTEFRYDYI